MLNTHRENSWEGLIVLGVFLMQFGHWQDVKEGPGVLGQNVTGWG